MTELHERLQLVSIDPSTAKSEIFQSVEEAIVTTGYSILEVDNDRPWGGFIRLDNNDADRFLGEFFDGMDTVEARLGMPDAQLSPKILIAAPKQRLSWQFHDRRAERWAFLTDGGYFSSHSDQMGNEHEATRGDIVQFSQGQRHRLTGAVGHYTLVAEIWQHTNKHHPSDEADIVRVQDDYAR